MIPTPTGCPTREFTRPWGLPGPPGFHWGRWAVITVVAMGAKVLGAGAGARWGGLSLDESLKLGVGMMSRGEVGLIVARAEIDAGRIGDEVFADVVIMVLLTTLVTPVLLRALYPKAGKPAEAAQS